MVFINKGAGNFPKSSPKRVLLYLEKKKANNLNDRYKEIKQEKEKGEPQRQTYRVKNVLKVYHTSIKKSVFNMSAGEIASVEALGNVSRLSPEEL